MAMANKFSFNGLIKSISKMMSEEEVVEKKQRLDPQQRAHQKEIEASILVLAAAVIRCDKNYTEATEKYINDFLARQFGGRNTVQRTKAVNEHVEMGTEAYINIACKELKLLATEDSRIHILHFLFGVADADEYINAKEMRCIQRISGYLGVTDKDFKRVKNSFVRENNPYKILELEEGVTLAEVKAAYRRMILKFHPDKKGESMSEEEANIKFRAIQKAFETIKRESRDK
jgi:DnaJ like chaperone protein